MEKQTIAASYFGYIVHPRDAAKPPTVGPQPMRKEVTLCLVLAAVLAGCPEPAVSTQDGIRYLQSILPDSLMEYANLEVASKKSLAIVEEGQREYLGLHLFPGQPKVNGGIRAEVSVNYPFVEGETVQYSWRFMLPPDFISDAPRNRWWLIGQWHDQPITERGESWQGFPKRSPPIAIWIGGPNGRLVLGLHYGSTNARDIGPIPLELGQWHNITVVIHWSRGADGSASVFLDDPAKPALSAEGPNMHNEYQHYLKLGMYRHPEINIDNWIYLDDVEISKPPTPDTG